MLIGKITRNNKETKNNKERLLVTVEDRKGVKLIDLRAYQIINDGELIPTSEGILLAPERIESLIGLLREAQKKISGE